MDRLQENLIEWITGSKTATVTFSQKKYINRIKKMAEKHPESIDIVAENEDGSVTAHIPVRAMHLTVYESKNKGFFGGAGDTDDDCDDVGSGDDTDDDDAESADDTYNDDAE